MVRPLVDHEVDRAQLQAGQPAQASATNRPSSSHRFLRVASPRAPSPARRAAVRVARAPPEDGAQSAGRAPRERGHGGGGTPDSIPNSEVKPAVAESTAASRRGRVGSRARAWRIARREGSRGTSPGTLPHFGSSPCGLLRRRTFPWVYPRLRMKPASASLFLLSKRLRARVNMHFLAYTFLSLAGFFHFRHGGDSSV